MKQQGFGQANAKSLKLHVDSGLQALEPCSPVFSAALAVRWIQSGFGLEQVPKDDAGFVVGSLNTLHHNARPQKIAF